MKRFLSLILVMTLLFSISMPAFADDNKSDGLWGSAKGLLGDVINDTTEATKNAWQTTSSVISEKWGTSSTAIQSALENADGKFKDAKEWTAAFLDTQGNTISDVAGKSYENLQNWLAETGDSSLDVLHIAYINAAERAGIAKDQAAVLWDKIQDFAEKNGIDMVTMVKLVLAILTMVVLNVTIGSDNIAGTTAEGYLEDTLLSWFENFQITDQASAEKALTQITESVDTYMDENSWVCPECEQENQGKYCSECGKARPKGKDTWVCSECKTKNEGRFCSNCGTVRPSSEETWKCSECKHENTGNYCVECGTPCPALSDTWICQKCEAENIGNFCSNCGTRRK